MKAGFILYADQYQPISKLSYEQKGKLLDALFRFSDGEEVSFDDPVLEMAFAFFRQSLERDSEKYERKCRKNRENIAKRYAKDTDVYNGKQTNTNDTTEYDPIQRGRDKDNNPITTQPDNNQIETSECVNESPFSVASEGVQGDSPPSASPTRPKKQAVANHAPEKLRFGENGNVRLTQTEIDSLVERYGPEDTDKAIALLDLHIGAKGKAQYKSDYHAMRKWVFDAVKEREAKATRASPRASPGSKPTSDEVVDYNAAVTKKLFEERYGKPTSIPGQITGH